MDGLRLDDAVNIQVFAGDVEDWLLINLSADTHPIHLHLPQFQVVERRPIDVTGYQAALDATRAVGDPNPDPAFRHRCDVTLDCLASVSACRLWCCRRVNVGSSARAGSGESLKTE